MTSLATSRVIGLVSTRSALFRGMDSLSVYCLVRVRKFGQNFFQLGPFNRSR